MIVDTETSQQLDSNPQFLGRLLITGFFSSEVSKVAETPPSTAITQDKDAHKSAAPVLAKEQPQAVQQTQEITEIRFNPSELTEQLGQIAEKLDQYSDQDIEQAVKFCMSKFRDLGLNSTELAQRHPDLFAQFMKLYNICRTRSEDLRIVEPTDQEVRVDSQRNLATVIDLVAKLNAPSQTKNQDVVDPPDVDISQLANATAVDINPADIASISQDVLSGKPSLLLSVLNSAGETVKWAFEHKKAIALLVAADAILFGGQYTYALGNIVGSTTDVLRFIGMDIKPSKSQKEVYLSALISELSTYNLFDFMRNRQPHELFTFLDDLSDETRKKIFSGDSFGGTFNNLHTFSEQQRKTLLSHLTKNQITDLGLQQFVKTD